MKYKNLNKQYLFVRTITILTLFSLILPSTMGFTFFEINDSDENIFNHSPGEVLCEKSAGSLGATLAVIDYDGDGDKDYIEGSFHDIFFITNDDDQFHKQLYCTLDEYNGYADVLDQGAIASAELNNDGQEDFITGGVQGFVRIFINNNSKSGLPQFIEHELAKFGQTVYGITVADFNVDGWMDFAVSHATSPFEYATITIFYNQKDLSFSQKDVYQHDTYIRDLKSGDFDGDGDIDLLFSYSKSIWHGDWPLKLIGVYSLLKNKGDDTFEPEEIIAERGRDLFFYLGINMYMTIQSRIRHILGLNRYGPQLTCADYDDDGYVDFLVGDNSGKVEHFINMGNGDFESGGVIHRYGHLSWGLASGDFDGDGDIDVIVSANNRYNDFEGNVWLIENHLYD